MLDFKLYPLTKAILQLLGLALAAYTLYLIKGILVYAVIALYISVLGRPILAFLGSLPKVGNSLSASVKALLTMVFFLLIALALASWVIPVLVREFSFLATIEYDALLRSLQEEWSQFDTVLLSIGVDTEAELEAINQSLQGFASVDAITSALNGIIGGIGQLSIGLFSITFISFFLFKEKDIAHRFVDSITPERYHNKVDAMTPQIKRVVTRYSFGILFQISAIFILLALGMSFIGVQGAIVLALFAAIFNLIPYVGPILGATLGIILGLGQLYAAGIADPAQSVDLVQSLYLLLALFFTVQLLDNIFFQPLIFSNSVGAHPLEIFLVISIAGTLLGVAGMVVAVPVYSIGRIIYNTAVETIDG